MTNSFMLEPFIFVSYNIKRTHVRNIYAETATVVEGMKKTCRWIGEEFIEGDCFKAVFNSSCKIGAH